MLAPGMAKLKDSISCVTYNGAQHTHVLINESDPGATLKKVTLNAPNGDWFSFDPDKGRGREAKVSALLATGAHLHHRACDCIVIVNRGGNLNVIYIDLKSGNPVGCENKFKSMRQFIRYAVGLLEEFHNEKLVISDERYVILYGGKPLPIQKTTTVRKPLAMIRSRPESPYKREIANNSRVHLRELLD